MTHTVDESVEEEVCDECLCGCTAGDECTCITGGESCEQCSCMDFLDEEDEDDGEEER